MIKKTSSPSTKELKQDALSRGKSYSRSMIFKSCKPPLEESLAQSRVSPPHEKTGKIEVEGEISLGGEIMSLRRC